MRAVQERLAARVVGRVQGVGFRATARMVAGRFNVTGWVRNEPDGTVMLELQGEALEVLRVIDEIKAEMSGYVRAADAITITDAPGERGFTVRH